MSDAVRVNSFHMRSLDLNIRQFEKSDSNS